MAVNFTAIDIQWMREAINLARTADQCGEVPIGAILVDHEKNEILGYGHNAVIAQSDPTAHAEIVALRAAGQARNNYRLIDTTLYVTLEPCPMCAMALVHARINKLVFAAADPRIGACGTQFHFHQHPVLNHRYEVVSGVFAEESAQLLKDFFKSRR